MTPEERDNMGENVRPRTLMCLTFLIGGACWWNWDLGIGVLVFLSLMFVLGLAAQIVYRARKRW